MTYPEKTIPFGLLNAVMTSPLAFALTSGGPAHEKTLAFSGQIVRHTQDAELIQAMVKALLPISYDGNSISEVPGMVADAIAKGFHTVGEQGPASKSVGASSIALKLVRPHLQKLFTTEIGEEYVVYSSSDIGNRCLRIGSAEFSKLVGGLYYAETEKPLPQLAKAEVLETLKAEATFGGRVEEVCVRVGFHDDTTYVDLGTSDGTLVKIDADRRSFVKEAPVNFVRPVGFRELPRPTEGGDLSHLQNALSLDDKTFVLTLIFLLSFFNPTGPRFGLIVQGEQGSGKSIFCSLLKRILDPSAADRSRMPSTEQEFAIIASHSALLMFDNASGVRWDISDMLCVILTGGSFMTRKLYSESDFVLFTFRLPFVINGIGDFANRPDLLERCLQVNLLAIDKDTRQTERELEAIIDEMIPAILGCIYSCVSHAYRNLENVDAPRSMRMADAIHWCLAAEPNTDLTPGTMLKVLTTNQEQMQSDRIANDPLALAIIALLTKDGQFTGTMGELHAALVDDDHGRRQLPKTPQHLSNNLTRIKPMMATVGLQLEIGERTRAGKMVTLRLDPETVSLPKSVEI